MEIIATEYYLQNKVEKIFGYKPILINVDNSTFFKIWCIFHEFFLNRAKNIKMNHVRSTCLDKSMETPLAYTHMIHLL